MLFHVLVCSLCLHVARADDWFWIDAKINGKRARLVLDTGCEPPLALFRHAAERLHLKLQAGERRNADQMPYWLTEECTVKLPWCFWGFARAKAQLTVVEIPTFMRESINMDGAVGWPIVSQRIIELDAVRQKFTFLRRLPKTGANGWTEFALKTNAPWGRLLAFELPDSDGSKGVILVDTGALGTGVTLSRQRWQEWIVAHTNQPRTLVVNYGPEPGTYVREQGLADEFSLGTLNLADVLIEEADPVIPRRLPDYAATFGLEALKRLDFIVDGKRGVAYLRPRRTPASRPPFEHNRLGAVFVPRDEQSDDLVAHVMDDSPASEAGIRNGDLLLKIGERDATKWRTQPGSIDWSNFCSPAGTRLEFTLARGNEILTTTAVLREILVPGTNSSGSTSR
jgi:hypothetical protein